MAIVTATTTIITAIHAKRIWMLIIIIIILNAATVTRVAIIRETVVIKKIMGKIRTGSNRTVARIAGILKKPRIIEWTELESTI